MATALIGVGLLWQAPAADSSNQTPPPDSARIRLPPRNTLINNVTFVVFDTETTGLNPKKDRLVELGAVKFKNGKVIAEKSWLINPQRSIPFWATEVHGITMEMVKDQPTFKEVYPEFEQFIQGAVLFAHNARFDISFMREELLRNNLTLPPNLTIDSLQLFRKWYPEMKSHRLSEVAERAQVTGGQYHRAEADSLYVFLIFDKMMQHRPANIKLRDIYSEAGGALHF
jgi:DNA polymerase-3 subunit alpha (Gram-positive type)